jgi:hypothetical protein
MTPLTFPPLARCDRRTFLFGVAALPLGGCFEKSCYESNPQQKKFVTDLGAIAKPAMASNNPLAIEEAVKRTLALSEAVGAFADWCGTLKAIDGNAQNVAVTIEVGPQVSLYAFNDWALAMAGAFADLFSTRSREAPPPGLSDQAVAALKTFRLGQHVQLSGRMGAIAGSGLFDLSRLFGKSDTSNRTFLQSPRFVASIEALSSSNKK